MAGKKATAEEVKVEKVVEVEAAVEEKAPAKKTTAKKATTKKDEKEVAEEKVPAKKTTTKKAVEAEKTTAKKTSSRKKENVTVMLQFAGNEYDVNEVTARVKSDFGNDKGIKDLHIYVKPEENMVYYVVNGEYEGKFSL